MQEVDSATHTKEEQIPLGESPLHSEIVDDDLEELGAL
jgi:hypothetical protein